MLRVRAATISVCAMADKPDLIEVHTRIGNDYQLWRHTAQTLFAAATVLSREYERVRSTLPRSGSGRLPMELYTVWTTIWIADAHCDANGEAPVYLRVSEPPPEHRARRRPSRGREMHAHRSAFPSSAFRRAGRCQK